MRPLKTGLKIALGGDNFKVRHTDDIDLRLAVAIEIEDTTSVDIRRAAAEALGEIGGEEAMALLVQLIKDSSPYVRQAGEEAIQKASDVRFI